MKHTLRAKYAADGLTAHRQRVSHQPAMVKAMKDRATLARIAARLKSDGRPQIVMADVREAAFANLSKWYADRMDKAMQSALFNIKPLPFAPADASQIKGLRADMVILDDLEHDDKFDAMTWAPPRRGLSYGFDFAKPGVKDFGVVMVNATC